MGLLHPLTNFNDSFKFDEVALRDAESFVLDIRLSSELATEVDKFVVVFIRCLRYL